MNLVLLSGGSGKRLWPLSNDVRSKQFIKILKNDDGNYESMIQRVFRQIKEVNDDSNIVVATSKTQISSINNQLNDDVDICVEPCRRDTFPAIALAVAYLKDIKGLSDDEVVAVCPVDPYVNVDYFQAVEKLTQITNSSDANLVLMGIEPTYPSEKYGYIIPKTKDDVSNVDMFKEKPTQEVAKEYLLKGALWNGGVFSFKVGYLLKIAHNLIDFTDYYDLYNKYETLNKISFDYAVVEHEEKIKVMKFSGQWKDLGTWNTLVEAMETPIFGNAILNDTCENVNVLNELDIPVLCMGLKDVIISASSEGILVSDNEQSSYIKPYVDNFDSRIMFADKSWGSFNILDIEKESLTIKIKLTAGHKMNYHSHERRDEVWTIVSGDATVVIEGIKQEVKAGDVVTIQAGCKHTIIAKTDLQILEVQIGTDISVSDKRKYDYEF